MPTTQIEKIYRDHIKNLPPNDRLRLVEKIVRDISQNGEMTEPKKHSIMELCGLGAEIWQDVDAQKYVDDLRSEWDRKP